MANVRKYSDIQSKQKAGDYVRSHKDLWDVWERMSKDHDEGTPSAEVSYWKRRMLDVPFTIHEFGHAHRGQDRAMFLGKINEGGIHRYAKEGEPTDKWRNYFKDGQLRALTGTYTPPEKTETTTDNTTTDNTTTDTTTDTTQQEIKDQITAQPTALTEKITELQTDLKTITAQVDRQSLGIPPDAPAHIKTYEQYREWLQKQASAVGYGSTVTTSMSGVEDMTEGVSKPLLTAVYPTSG